MYTFARSLSLDLGLNKAFAVTSFEVVKEPSREGGLKRSLIVAAANNIQYQVGKKEKKKKIKKRRNYNTVSVLQAGGWRKGFSSPEVGRGSLQEITWRLKLLFPDIPLFMQI